VAGWLIDTSVLVDAERGGEAIALVPAGDPHLISVITVSELLHGVHRAPDDARRTKREAFVEYILGELETLPATAEIARIHARVWAQLEARGEAVGAHDLWIAATALAHGLPVVTANPRELKRVPGLEVLAV
jgi:tRNA(fMet)-specific endonuclease VapC